MPIVLRCPAPWSLRSWLQEQPSNDDFRTNRQFRRLSKKQPLSGDSLPQSSDPATEAVPDVEEHPIVPEQNRTIKLGRASGCAGENGTMVL